MGNVPACGRESGELYFVYDESNPLSSKVAEELEAQVGEYKPPWWYNKHLASSLHMGKAPILEYTREVLHHDDGSQFTCDHYPPQPVHAGDGNMRVVVVVPALGGDSSYGYVRILVKALLDRGFNCVVLNVRGTAQKLTTPRPFHATDCSDLALLVEYVHQKHEDADLFLIGFSMGGNFVSRYLMEAGEHAKAVNVRGAMSVCNSFNYLKALNKLEAAGAWGAFYSKAFVEIFKGMFQRNKEMLQNHVDFDALEKVQKLSELDQTLAKSVYGYKRVESFWEAASSVHRLAEVAVPFLALQTLDDPAFADAVREIVPLEEMSKNANIVYMENKYGGHFGYVEGDIGDMYTNDRTYTYPARVAGVFFDIAARYSTGISSGDMSDLGVTLREAEPEAKRELLEEASSRGNEGAVPTTT